MKGILGMSRQYFCNKTNKLTHKKGGVLVYSKLETRNLLPNISIGLLVLILAGCSATGGFERNLDEPQTSTPPAPCILNSVTVGPCLIEKAAVSVSDIYGSDISTWVNPTAAAGVVATIPNGFYANHNVLFSEPNLVAANIKSGVSIFGVTGNASGVLGLCATNGLQSTSCSVVANTYWTNQLGANIIVADGVLASVITAGYYDGSQTLTMSDSDLVANKIKSGVNIFGVAGSVIEESHNSCSANGQSGCITTTNIVSGTLRNSFSATNGTLNSLIPQGYYDGTKSVSFTDVNLISTNIVFGATIFGVTGSAVAAYSACADGGLNNSQCSTAANRYVYSTANGGRSLDCSAGANASACWTNNTNQYVTGTLGTNVSSWSNSGTTTVSGAIAAGYYSGNTISFTDAGLISSNIRAGTSIFNVAGAYYGPAMSNMHRDKTTTQISQSNETITGGGALYTNADPAGYRAIPKISKDDDGNTGGSVTKVSRTNWDTTCDATTGAGGGTANNVCKCGTTGSIDLRIADCAAHAVIGANSTWDGSTKANAGQGTWKLVTRTGSVSLGKGREVWRDEQTKLIWSSLVATTLNWCKASGSNNIAGNPVAEVDPQGYCGNAGHTAAYQNNTGQAVSACFEDDGTYFTQTGTDQLGKGGLSRASSPVVGWRLPTKYDYQQADNNGLRFVVPDVNWEWSASVYSVNRVNAWIFDSDVGLVYVDSRISDFAVRCVGR